MKVDERHYFYNMRHKFRGRLFLFFADASEGRTKYAAKYQYHSCVDYKINL